MRRLIPAILLVVSLSLTIGCGPGVTTGSLYTDTTIPADLSDNAVVGQSGEACSMSILGIVNTGDASIKAAADEGGIDRVGAVNTRVNSILGLYAQHCTVVSGE